MDNNQGVEPQVEEPKIEESQVEEPKVEELQVENQDGDIEKPETNIIVDEKFTASSTVVAGKNKATGGATLVEGETPSAGVSTFGDQTMELISKEAAEAALRVNNFTNLDISNAMNIANNASATGNVMQQNISQPVQQYQQPMPQAQPVEQDSVRTSGGKLSKVAIFFYIILGIACAVGSFAVVTFLLQR